MRLSLGLNVERFKLNFSIESRTERIVSALGHGFHVVVHLQSYSFMSLISSSSLASGRNPESSYRDSSTSDRDHLTPSPPVQEDSHDEYTPTRKSTHGTWTTPSQCSHTASISSSAREALDRLYKLIYGEDSLRCLITQSNESLNVPHIVQRASRSDEVNHGLRHKMPI
jgi:hypothetical protein